MLDVTYIGIECWYSVVNLREVFIKVELNVVNLDVNLLVKNLAFIHF